MLKKQLPFFLVLFLTLLLIALVFWVYERRIQQIEKEMNTPATPTFYERNQ